MEFSAALSLALPIAVSILVAAGGWGFTYFHSRHMAAQNAQLERVNDQLRLLYGPLYARLKAGDAAWDAFWGAYQPEHGQNAYFADGFDLSDEELARWRLWMKEVFHPNNSSLEALLLEHMDLMDGMDGDEMPEVFIETLSHISVYHAVLAQWEKGDFSEHTSVMNFPYEELLDLVEPTYLRLRATQKKLIAGLSVTAEP